MTAKTTDEQDMVQNKHVGKVIEFFHQVGMLEEITEESTDDEKMYDGNIRHHVASAIENAVIEAESIYLPQIQQLQEEIERLKEYEWKYKELCK